MIVSSYGIMSKVNVVFGWWIFFVLSLILGQDCFSIQLAAQFGWSLGKVRGSEYPLIVAVGILIIFMMHYLCTKCGKQNKRVTVCKSLKNLSASVFLAVCCNMWNSTKISLSIWFFSEHVLGISTGFIYVFFSSNHHHVYKMVWIWRY